MGGTWSDAGRVRASLALAPAPRRLRLTKRGRYVLSWLGAVALICAPGFAEMIGNLLVGPTS